MVEWRSSLRTFRVFIGLAPSGMPSMRQPQIRLLFPAAEPLTYSRRYVLVCQRTARLRKQIRVHPLRRTHPADTKMPFCLMSNRGVAAPNPALSFFLFFFFSLPSLCYSRLGDYDRLATPCIKKPSIGLSKFLCSVSQGAIGSK